MKVLVTGSTGFLGTHLIQRLLQEGAQITAIVRQIPDDWIFKDKVKVVVSDLTKMDRTLDQALQGQQIVFHLAGLVSYKRIDYPQLMQVNVESTVRLYEKSCRAHVGAFVYVSSVAAIGATQKPHILRESDQVWLQGPEFGYFESKRLAEEKLRAIYLEGGIPCYWINPTTVYGEGDYLKDSRRVQKLVALGKFRWYPPGGINVVDVNDVVEALWQVWQKGQPCQRYIIGAENITIKTLFEWILHVAGQRIRLWPLPCWVLNVVATLGRGYEKLKGSLPHWAHYARLAQLYHWYDGSKAQNELGLRYRPAFMAVEKSVRSFLKGFQK